MKTITSYITTILLCTCMAVFVSCNSNDDPMTAQKQMVADELTSLYQGNIDDFISHADYGDFDLTDSVRYAIVHEALAAFVQGINATDGGFDRIEATSAELTSDSTAFVYYDLYFRNGSVQSHSQKIQLRNGQWQLRVKE